jgi:hypothetical protein
MFPTGSENIRKMKSKSLPCTKIIDRWGKTGPWVFIKKKNLLSV